MLAFGDSLTYGTGVDSENSYPSLLGTLIGREVINAGIPGETTRQGLARLPGVMSQYNPDLVILIEGGNDFLRRLPRKETRENLHRMVELIKSGGAQVILVAVPEPNLLLSSADLYEELARELRVPYLDGVLAEILSDRALKSDPIHPNQAGYRRLAEAIAVFLQEQGAI